jgi:NAD+ diphosphatase
MPDHPAADRFFTLYTKRITGRGHPVLTHTGKFCADSLRAVYPEPERVPDTAWWVLVRGEEVALRPGTSPAVVVLSNPAKDKILLQDHIYLGLRGVVPCYAGIMGPESPAPGNWQFSGVRDLFVMIPSEELAIAALAVRIARFDRTTQFCSRCGAATRPVISERARYCPSCSQVFYPRVSPAVIVLVQRDDRILLARSPRFPPGMFGLVAGFVEPGENLEHAIRREVIEETGIQIKNIRYFGSEPWPFPDSLMVGFVADYAGGELKIDHHEIESAFWFDREHLPLIPEKLSISRALIDWWLQENTRSSHR